MPRGSSAGVILGRSGRRFAKRPAGQRGRQQQRASLPRPQGALRRQQHLRRAEAGGLEVLDDPEFAEGLAAAARMRRDQQPERVLDLDAGETLEVAGDGGLDPFDAAQPIAADEPARERGPEGFEGAGERLVETCGGIEPDSLGHAADYRAGARKRDPPDTSFGYLWPEGGAMTKGQKAAGRAGPPKSSGRRRDAEPNPGRRTSRVELSRALIRALPKTDLHVHLDGSLRLETLIELAAERNVKLPSRSPEGLRRLVFKRAYRNLPEYLKGFEYTVACLRDAEALERAAFELAEDCRAENVHYLELRFAPQLHAREGFGLREVVRAVCRGLERAEKRFNQRKEVREKRALPFRAGVIVCAMRFFNAQFSPHYAAYFQALPTTDPERIAALASLELARVAVAAADEGLPVVGFDLAGCEAGFPAEAHREAYQYVHDHFLGKTVHAGEDYGPESIFQAITVCHADRIGHGTWLFSQRKIQDPRIKDRKSYVEKLVRYVAERRITLEVCLTSNQQTLPEFRDDLRRHPFRRMRRARLSTTICTDNRLVSNTTVTDEIWKAVQAFGLDRKELESILLYGFKRSFWPGPYREKRAYVRRVIDEIRRHLGGDAGETYMGGGTV